MPSISDLLPKKSKQINYSVLFHKMVENFQNYFKLSTRELVGMLETEKFIFLNEANSIGEQLYEEVKDAGRQ